MSKYKRIVIIEDEFLIADFLHDICNDLDGVEVVGVAHTADEARELLLQTRPNWVLMDVRLGGRRDGVDVAQEYFGFEPEAKVIFITGSNEPPTLERINMDHPYKILIKPISPNDLRKALL